MLAYGKTDSAAVRELNDLIESQFTFARQMKDDSLLLHRAPQEFFDRWEKAHEAALRKEITQDKSAHLDIRAISISLDKKSLRKSKSKTRRFELACA